MGHNQQHLLDALSPCALSLSAISVKKAHAALVVPDRCRLNDDLLEKLMFIRCNEPITM